MTAALFSRGKASRAAAAACAVTLGLIALTACDKPTPVATVTVGSHSETSEATKGCYTEGKRLDDKTVDKCLDKKPSETITVHAGEKIRIGVDPEIADSGWILLSGRNQISDASTDTYRTFDHEDLFQVRNQMGQLEQRDEIVLSIVELPKQGAPKGMWQYQLKLKS
ncbi:hypothetical protein IHE55_16980 [Streptomyces pactum]|uniref:DUF2771 domain-containing protein n=1 Tax=Streptomyces pactum TaxID=68249 RepID=A0ABS0NMU2_9ACTN|nr:hypothetical protein [Streptomyces pactum]MBH5336379.1 hypothetical protein [Streptomyces pactum]